ncbi:hypothetical protein NQ318_007541 [Aromia moschata]|uniref:Uncharacterized protein n=1 Tax=Aromia moschata TaxID=1265417 RepID=A0AAV8YE47_9CUCU|nr:hypothetical protein NQ318_007541 [Aromia moschata]
MDPAQYLGNPIFDSMSSYPGVGTGTLGVETKNWTFSTKHQNYYTFSSVSPTKLASSGED